MAKASPNSTTAFWRRKALLASPLARRILNNFLLAVGLPIVLMMGLSLLALRTLDPQSLAHAQVIGIPITRWLLGVGASALLVAAVLCVIQNLRIVIALDCLQRGARQIARRELGARVELQGDDDIADLGRAFNTMAERLEAQFHALDMLAAIDQDILEGVPVDRVVARVIAELQLRVPSVIVSLVRLESEQSPVLREMLSRGAGAPVKIHRLRLTPEQLQRFSSGAKDGVLTAAQAARHPWSLACIDTQVDRVVCLPVRAGQETQAMILIGLAPETQLDADMRRISRELRDRVGVALATHRRDSQLAFRAVHDALTGLFNRVGLHEHVDAMLAGPDCTDGTRRPALLCIDLDRFKQVNDSLGHEVGDDLLRQAAERIQGCAPPGAVVARLGGDEFVVVLPDVPAARPAHACEVAQQICTRLGLPFRLRGQDRVLGGSVGIALAGHGTGRDELMRHADIAMYEAKRTGRGRYAVFEQPLDNQVLERNELLAEMRDAVARHEFILHFQPRIRSADGQVVSAEALVRWNHPRRGLLMPGRFIELAEGSDLIDVIGNEVLDQACAQMAAWHRTGVQVGRVSVNVSPRQLQSGQLLKMVRAALTRHDVPASCLELEVTESLLVGDAREAHAQLAELRRWGALIALDDFGTGYSSMATLHQLPIDVMKVDRAFVKNIDRDASALAITRAIVALAQSLGLHTVAEGMETETQTAMVRELGIHEMQGYYFSKPVPAEDFAAFVAEGRRAVPLGLSAPRLEGGAGPLRRQPPIPLAEELKISLYQSMLSDFTP